MFFTGTGSRTGIKRLKKRKDLAVAAKRGQEVRNTRKARKTEERGMRRMTGTETERTGILQPR